MNLLTFRAISLHEPYASFVVDGEKRIETRSWSTQVRGRVLIHAAKVQTPLLNQLLKPDVWFSDESEEMCRQILRRRNYNSVNSFTLGAIIGVVTIVSCLPSAQFYPKYCPDDLIPKGGVELTGQEQLVGNFSAGRYGWILENPVRFDEPIPYRGYQGFFNVPEIPEKYLPLVYPELLTDNK